MSLPISFPPSIAASVLDTVLARLAPLLLLGAAGDLTVARHAAAQMLAAYDSQTGDELRLAGKLVGLSFQCLEALSDAAAPDLSLTAKLRLRSSAVSLSRESHKAQRQLDRLQRARRSALAMQAAEAQPVSAANPDPGPEAVAANSIEATSIDCRPDTAAPAGKTSPITWTQADHKRQMAQRITERLKKNQAEHATRAVQQAPATQAAGGRGQPNFA